MAKYQLQNCYQDSSWENLDDEAFSDPLLAEARAKELAKDAICYGMVRVVDLNKAKIIATFPAGYSGR